MIFSSKNTYYSKCGGLEHSPRGLWAEEESRREIPEITPWSMSQLRKAQAQEKIAPLNQLPR